MSWCKILLCLGIFSSTFLITSYIISNSNVKFNINVEKLLPTSIYNSSQSEQIPEASKLKQEKDDETRESITIMQPVIEEKKIIIVQPAVIIEPLQVGQNQDAEPHFLENEDSFIPIPNEDSYVDYSSDTSSSSNNDYIEEDLNNLLNMANINYNEFPEFEDKLLYDNQLHSDNIKSNKKKDKFNKKPIKNKKKGCNRSEHHSSSMRTNKNGVVDIHENVRTTHQVISNGKIKTKTYERTRHNDDVKDHSTYYEQHV